MRAAFRFTAAILIGIPTVTSGLAQAPTPNRAGSDTQAPNLPTATLTVGTQLVVVDATAQDKKGNPVHDLRATDFRLSENRNPVPIKTFDEHRGSPANLSLPSMPQLPPGTFTDFNNLPDNGLLTVLLLDSLNTTTGDQAFVRSELERYVKQPQQNTRIAIFGLNSQLVMLQGFTSDPALLKAAINRKQGPRPSPILKIAGAANIDEISMQDELDAIGVSANLQQFEAQAEAVQTATRVQYTIDAFAAIGRYLQALPGRKNVIWFSGSFPLAIFPNPDFNDTYATTGNFTGQLQEISSLLTRARIAVYPMDARGTQTIPTMDASRSGEGYVRTPAVNMNETKQSASQTTVDHLSMEQLANDTGGHALYSSSGLAEAVRKTIAASENYYTLTYSPTNKKSKGEYRRIDLKLQGDAADQGTRLSYRHGYYADDPDRHRFAATTVTSELRTKSSGAGHLGYLATAMSRGAPTPSEIPFTVRVLPVSLTTDEKVAPHNLPASHLKGPFRLYQVDYVSTGDVFQVTKVADGKFNSRIEYTVFVYDAAGRLLNIDTNTMNLTLGPTTYRNLANSGFRFSLQVSVPAKKETFLRIAVHDIPSGRIGVVEVPSASIDHLSPVPTEQRLATPTAVSAASK